MSVNRRQLLKALGLGALLGPRLAPAAPSVPPRRIVFFVQPHGHVPSSWKMPIAGGPTNAVAERDLTSLAKDELSSVLRPLHAFRNKLIAIEGLAHTSVLEDIANLQRLGGGDFNNHNLAVAGLLTGARSAQHAGFPSTGGAKSIDQVLAQRLTGPGRFASRVYGGDYIPNQVVAPFSFLGASQPTPLVRHPVDGYHDLLGAQPPVNQREQKLALARLSMLDSVGEEYRLVANRLGATDKLKLDAHRALVHDLAVQLATKAVPACDTGFDATTTKGLQFMRLIAMALSCDLTRVVTYAAPVPLCPEFSYPANADVHASYAHASVAGLTSCGQIYSPLAEQAMTDLSTWYGQQLAALLTTLDSVPEGNGTVLDNTVVVWLTELGTPTHRHHDAFTVLIGGCQGFFKTGRYVRYPILHDSPVMGTAVDWPRIGPAHNKLFVSLFNALGQSDTQFGTSSATSNTGEPIDLSGPLVELHA